MDRCHIIHAGMGAKKGGGNGCECEINMLYLSRKQHDILDRRTPCETVEHLYNKLQPYYLQQGYKLSQIYLLAFGRVFGYERKIILAIEHNNLRKQGKADCCKWVRRAK